MYMMNVFEWLKVMINQDVYKEWMKNKLYPVSG